MTPRHALALPPFPGRQADGEIRTLNLSFTKAALYRCATSAQGACIVSLVCLRVKGQCPAGRSHLNAKFMCFAAETPLIEESYRSSNQFLHHSPEAVCELKPVRRAVPAPLAYSSPKPPGTHNLRCITYTYKGIFFYCHLFRLSYNVLLDNLN